MLKTFVKARCFFYVILAFHIFTEPNMFFILNEIKRYTEWNEILKGKVRSSINGATEWKTREPITVGAAG
jgi:hypothetical protein